MLFMLARPVISNLTDLWPNSTSKKKLICHPVATILPSLLTSSYMHCCNYFAKPPHLKQFHALLQLFCQASSPQIIPWQLRRWHPRWRVGPAAPRTDPPSRLNNNLSCSTVQKMFKAQNSHDTIMQWFIRLCKLFSKIHRKAGISYQVTLIWATLDYTYNFF